MTLTRALIVAHGHPELSKGGAEIAAYQHFRALRRVPTCRASFLGWREDGPELALGEDFQPFEGRVDEYLFHARQFDRFRFSQLSEAVRLAFKRLIERLDVDVVHFHHYVHIGVELIAIARSRARPLRIIVTFHEFLALCHNEGVMVRRTAAHSLCERADPVECANCYPELDAEAFRARESFIKAHLSLADAFVSPSRFLRDRYIAWGLPKQQMFVIENGIEPIEAPSARRRRRGEGRNVFGYFGQIHPYKGLLQLLAAFERLAKEPGAPARLIIHGAYLELNHPRFIRAFNEAHTRCGPSVEFAGAYERENERELMRAVDWVIVPSIWWENAPLVIEEALACRRPVICADIGGMREKVRNGLDGVWVPVGDSQALATTIRRLSQDESAWRRMRASLRRPTAVIQSVKLYLSLYRGEPRLDPS